jgi:AraC-like DNA-binding protein
MKEHAVCHEAIAACLASRRFTVAHLFKEEKTMNMHSHESLEVYYSISGGQQFFIDKKYYSIQSGDAFVINERESHCLTQIDPGAHERIVLSIHPAYLAQLSTPQTDLSYCFYDRSDGFSHRVHIDKSRQRKFMYLIHKIVSAEGFGADAIENAAFTELMVMLNGIFRQREHRHVAGESYRYNKLVEDVIDYINNNLTDKTTLSAIAENFYISDTHLCRVFKAETGATIHQYLRMRRLSIAKQLLAKGCSVAETCEQSGFNDYANFIRTFTKTVGIPPKQFAKSSLS